MFVYNHQILVELNEEMPKLVTRALLMLEGEKTPSKQSCMDKQLSDEYCHSRDDVPYPDDPSFDPTLVKGLCDAFLKLRYQPLEEVEIVVEDDGKQEEGADPLMGPADPIIPVIVAVMARLLKGLEDPAIARDFWGPKPHEVPKLTGGSSDNLVDLPMCVRQQLEKIEKCITKNTSEQINLQVRDVVLRLSCYICFFASP